MGYFKNIARVGTVLILLFFIMFNSSCTFGPDKDLQKHYAEVLFDSAAALVPTQGIESAINMVDLAYNAFPFISIVDKYRYYRFKTDMYSATASTDFATAKKENYALKYLDSNILLIEQNNKTEALANEYANLLAVKASFCLFAKEYTRAGEYLSRSRVICLQSGNLCTLAEIAATVASLYYQQGKFKESLKYYKQALAEIGNCNADATDNFYRMQGWLDNEGLCYAKMGKADSAIMVYKEALAFVEKNKSIYAHNNNPNFPNIVTAIVKGNLAVCYANKQDYKQAEDYFRSSINIIDSNNAKGYPRQSNQETLIQLAGMYIQWQRPDSAYPLLTKVSLLYPNADDDTKLLWQKGMWQYFKSKKDVVNENYYLKGFLNMQDSASAKKKPLFETNIIDLFEHDEKEYQLKILEKEDKIKLFYIAASVGFASLMLVLLALFYYNWYKAGIAVRRLTILNRKAEQREGQLNGLVENLTAKNVQKERIMRLIAHDLRNPISNIKMLSSIFAEDMGLDEHEFLKLSNIACADSLRLVDEILTMSENNENIVLQKQLVNLDELLYNSVALMRMGALEKKQHISLVQTSRDMLVEVDPEMIRRVINNIIGNAIKFSPEGKEIKVTSFAAEEYYQIIIEDNGIGIDVKHHANIFDTFTSARRPGTKGEKSFGLGLSICRQIVEAHKGRLWFTSEIGKGTAFYIELSNNTVL